MLPPPPPPASPVMTTSPETKSAAGGAIAIVPGTDSQTPPSTTSNSTGGSTPDTSSASLPLPYDPAALALYHHARLASSGIYAPYPGSQLPASAEPYASLVSWLLGFLDIHVSIPHVVLLTFVYGVPLTQPLRLKNVDFEKFELVLDFSLFLWDIAEPFKKRTWTPDTYMWSRISTSKVGGCCCICFSAEGLLDKGWQH